VERDETNRAEQRCMLSTVCILSHGRRKSQKLRRGGRAEEGNATNLGHFHIYLESLEAPELIPRGKD
jgi:hypothetical protein